jgi:hypothetical protein
MKEIQPTGAIFDRKEAAEYLHICKTTLDRLDIPRSKIRRRVLYRQSVLDRYLEENTITAEVQA